jgi:hypothetical protein
LVSKYDYANDDLARRTQVDYSGTAFNSPNPPIGQSLEYNDRNELTRGERTNMSWSYEYDPIGNRTDSRHRVVFGSGELGILTTYQANALNQYPVLLTPATPGGSLEVSYDADGNLTQLATLLPADMNCDGVVTQADADGFALALENCEAYALEYPNCYCMNADCNADGVLNFSDIDCFNAHINDNGVRWRYTWDAENRLIAAEPGVTQLPGFRKMAAIGGPPWSLRTLRRLRWAPFGHPCANRNAGSGTNSLILRKLGTSGGRTRTCDLL